MSSPYRLSADRARSSPSRQRLNGYHASNRNSHHEAQSSQLIDELSRLLVDDDRSFKKKLDEESQLQQKKHVDALEKALAQHEAVRKSAEHAYETIQLEAERQRLAREVAQKRKLEEERRKLAEAQEAERRRLESERREMEERKRRAEQLEREQKARVEREAAEKKQEHDVAQARENAAREKAVAEQKAKEEAAEAQKLEQAHSNTQQAQQPNQSTTWAPSGVSQQQSSTNAAPAVQQAVSASPQAFVSTREDRLRLHNAYLQIHARCKALREEIDTIKTSDRQLYDAIKDRSRQIKQTVGQLTKGDRKGNQEKARKLIDAWKWSAACAPNVTADLNDYRLEPVQAPPVPKVFLYMVNFTSKMIIKQMGTESGANAEFAEPLGIMAAVVFANPECKPQGHLMSDMFLAKFHKAHSSLFGVTYNELTMDGRKRLGFRDEYGDKEGWFRAVRGMSRGYAALTLRDFSKSQNANPFPNRLFWEALARVSMTPQKEQVQVTFVTLEGLLDPFFIPRFVGFYGDMAMAAMRHVTIDFPQTRDLSIPAHATLAKVLEGMHLKFEDLLNLRL